MEAIREIRDILSRLNQREIKAARNYFSQHYNHTKELQLFNIIERMGLEAGQKTEERINGLGYGNGNSKSFQKLRTRLKNKLYDYLATSMSLEEIRQIDDNSFMKHRLRKHILQAGILIEKGFFMQANDILRSCLRLAQEYEQFGDVARCLNSLKTIYQLYNNRVESEKLGFKAKYYQGLEEKYLGIESAFFTILNDIELHALNNVDKRIENLKDEISEWPDELHRDCILLIGDCLDIATASHEGRLNDGLSLIIKRLKKLRGQSMKHDIVLKMACYSSFVEALFASGRNKRALHFIHHPIIEAKPFHLRYRLNAAMNYQRLTDVLSGDSAVQLQHLPADGSNELIYVYQSIHWEFLNGNFRKTLGLIDSNIRKFSVDSHQSVDLMILEILCLFEEERLDVVDYKIQSYIKNLSYRKNYAVPPYYLIISRIFQTLLRPSFERDPLALERLMKELTSAPVSGLLSGRSMQPRLVIKWVSARFARHMMYEV